MLLLRCLTVVDIVRIKFSAQYAGLPTTIAFQCWESNVLLLELYELQLQCVDIRSKPGPFSFLAMVFELQNNCAQQLSGQCPPKTLPQVDWQNKLTAQDTANRKNILERAALHMVGAPKVWIDQSGFSRQEELYHRDVQWMFTERHWKIT